MTPLEALYRCQRAWEATQPQLFFELWPDDGLDEREACRPSLVEPVPAASPVPPSGGGLEPRLTAGAAREGNSAKVSPPEFVPAVSLRLNPGAEPCRDLLGTDGESALLTAAPAHGKTEPRLWANGSAAGASAPLSNQTGPDATPAEGARPAQRRSV